MGKAATVCNYFHSFPLFALYLSLPNIIIIIQFMDSKNLATITGVKKHQLPTYIDYLQVLNFQYQPQFFTRTNLLVVASVSTEKFKIAQTFKPNLQIVTIEWLQQSYQAGECLPFQNFRIQSIFYGCLIGIWDISEKITEKLIEKIKLNGGNAVKLNHQLKPELSLQFCANFDAIIMEKKFYQNILFLRKNNTTVPFVGVQWIQASLTMEKIRFPRDYAYNLEVHQVSMSNQILKLKNQLHQRKKQVFLQNSNMLLQNMIFYLDQNIDYTLKKLLKKVICIHKGMYVKTLCPIATHILVNSRIQEKQYSDLMKFGNVIPIIKLEWLIDSLIFTTIMKEEDYKIRYFAIKETEKYQRLEVSATATTVAKKYSTFVARQTKSVSTFIEPQKKKVQVVHKKLKSSIFKDCLFYLDDRIRKEKCIQNIVHLIRQNGGTPYSGIKKGQKMYCILIDSLESIKIFQEASTKKEANLTPISFRWIRYCVQKGVFISPEQENFFIFKPFKFSVPLSSFMVSKFEIVGVDDSLRQRLRELLKELGSDKIFPEKAEITHCLCGSGWKQKNAMKRIEDIRKVNEKVKVVQLDWLFECVNKGAMISIDKFTCV